MTPGAAGRGTPRRPADGLSAYARDVLLIHAYGIQTGCKTKDIDFAMMVESWDAFSALRQAATGSGELFERPGPIHRLRHSGFALPLDIVPFGGVKDLTA